MIRVVVATNDLEARVDAAVPTWRTRAAKLDKAAAKAGELGKATIWSEVKEIFIEVQHKKCLYCETPLPIAQVGDKTMGKGISDIEHYRPKGRVTDWPTKNIIARRKPTYTAKLRAARADGYPHIAHTLGNYGLSCKICNSDLKGDRFPIAGSEGALGDDIPTLDASEVPLLLFPIGEAPVDPDAYLQWDGLVVRPLTKSGAKHLRARVTIDFFELDTRDDLARDRAMRIYIMQAALERAASSDPAKAAAGAAQVERFMADDFPAAACARAYRRLCDENPQRAEEIHQLAVDLLMSQEPSLF